MPAVCGCLPCAEAQCVRTLKDPKGVDRDSQAYPLESDQRRRSLVETQG
jgi:hypothetical protein